MEKLILISSILSIMHVMNKKLLTFSLTAIYFSLNGCVTEPPDNINNLCDIFTQYPNWYGIAKKTKKKWNIPISTQLAVIHQESKFNAKALQPRTKLLWVIPWKRKSTSYGYTQAINATWKNYKQHTGKKNATRTNFADSTDFIGWYANQLRRKTGVLPNNTYALYLAYHEGINGYKNKTYLNNHSLRHVAQKVSSQAKQYHRQYLQCKDNLSTGPWYRFW